MAGPIGLAHSSKLPTGGNAMKGPEQWFAIVRALGKSFFNLCFQLTYNCLQIDYTYKRVHYDGYDNPPTPHHSPPHYHQRAGGQQQTGIRETGLETHLES